MRRSTKGNVVRRGKNLTDDAIEQIVRLLDAWSGKLTWEGLIEAVVPRLHCRYTRQALHKHERIRAAYALRKSLLGSGKAAARRGSWQADEAAARIARLEAENQRLEAENERLLEQFVVWAYNAHLRGISKEFLSEPLPRVNRNQTLPAPKQVRTPTKSR
ncbi:hypothetical protein A9R16_002920 [Acidiferrobacter thiooxydans]|uniref:hypothetical protein n=1 Tax=Acidiferrobacter thiooxydans TaxID=163359 RepID=UPI00082710CE|nr:hypothetical protein [Acidiferrobacter thiooxydans]MDA8120256.1 hypothetical protein [Gammaproteobacteria bacterium]UEO00368.1 hypothetical protein A9R16_002920 [Acidiferrobacter thiooxydans]